MSSGAPARTLVLSLWLNHGGFGRSPASALPSPPLGSQILSPQNSPYRRKGARPSLPDLHRVRRRVSLGYLGNSVRAADCETPPSDSEPMHALLTPRRLRERSLPASGTVQRLGVLRLQGLLGGRCQPGKPFRREWPQTWPRKDGMGRRKRRNWSQDPLWGLNEASIVTVDRIQAFLFLWLIQYLPACLALNLSALDVSAHLMLIKSFRVVTIIGSS